MAKKKIIIMSAISIAVLGVFGAYSLMNNNTSSAGNGKTAILYKSPTCGCCAKYAAYIKSQGYDVEVVKTNDMSAIKDKYNIPHNMESCHTMVIGDHVIEGHIPIEGIDYLLTQRPDLDGIALPGMPIGSPGMPGFKAKPFEIFSLENGIASNLINL